MPAWGGLKRLVKTFIESRWKAREQSFTLLVGYGNGSFVSIQGGIYLGPSTEPCVTQCRPRAPAEFSGGVAEFSGRGVGEL